MVVTLDDFIKKNKKVKHAISPAVDSVKPVKQEPEQIKAGRVIAFTPLGKIKVKQLVQEGKLNRYPEPYWWNEVPDTIPGCFGESLSEPKCENCSVKGLCEMQALCTGAGTSAKVKA